MSKQYWIGGFFIDLSRNQITQNNRTQTLAPKALAVLTCLAEHHGKVVSQDTLLNEVWPDTVVTPNTLQRSIAQLRKALGDDGKGQNYIKTHAKQGYSLESDVRWREHTPNTTDMTAPTGTVSNSRPVSGANSKTSSLTNNQPPGEGHKPRYVIAVMVVAVVLLLGFWGYRYLLTEPTSTLAFDTLNSLTATDDKEFDPSYSPDGKYIVFPRYLDKQCINKIWAKKFQFKCFSFLS